MLYYINKNHDRSVTRGSSASFHDVEVVIGLSAHYVMPCSALSSGSRVAWGNTALPAGMMFDFAWSEFALIGVVALLVIGPKDMPTAIRAAAKAVKKARRLASDFQGHVDEMVREADLGEVRDQVRQLRSLNVRNQIMRTIDGDGSLRRTMSDPVLSGRPFETPVATPALPASAVPDFLPPPARDSVGASPLGIPPLSSGNDDDNGAFSGPAPAFVPPSIARRVASAWPRLHPPAILPPARVLHGHHRIALGSVPSPKRSATGETAPDASRQETDAS